MFSQVKDKGVRGARSNMVNEKNDVENANPKVFVFRSFVESEGEQSQLVEEALRCHAQNQGNRQDIMRGFESISTSKTSLKLNLGIPCGGDLTNILPKSADIARLALDTASMQAAGVASKTLKLVAQGPLSGLSLLYGVGASMPSHYDSPTQPGQRDEWLAMITLGNSVTFRCNSDVLTIHSGDALVMDSMAVLHGVERILPDISENPVCSRIGLSNQQARLGILFWQARETSKFIYSTGTEDGIPVDDFCVDGLFGDDGE
jgi:hypothetical protein